MTARPTIGSLFSGYGGLDLAVEDVLDGETVWTCDVDPAASRILRRRFPDAPNLGDITGVDWPRVRPVKIVTGGFPCQDVSHAGARAGLGPGTRTGLWARMADAIDHLRPQLVVAENVRGLLSAPADSDVEPCPWCMGGAGDGEPALRALGSVLADLADLGYDAAWHGLRAADVGAPHGRFRVFILAWPADPEGGLEQVEPPSNDRRPAVDGTSSRAGARDRGGHPAARVRVVGRGPGLVGEAAGDAGRVGIQRRSDPRNVAGTPRTGEGEGIQRERWRDTAGDASPDARDADSVAGKAGRALGRGSGTLDEPGSIERVIGPDRLAVWGPYEPAIRRWERALGRVAPAPTEPGSTGQPRLSPRFVEWLMGLPDGWVTDVPGLSRNDQLKALGNGVVPQQAATALRILLAWRAAAVGEAVRSA